MAQQRPIFDTAIYGDVFNTSCPHCSETVSVRAFDAGLADVLPLYCNRCPNIAAVGFSDWLLEQIFFHTETKAHQIPYPAAFWRELEAALAPCPCRGNFSHNAEARCPHCEKVLFPGRLIVPDRQFVVTRSLIDDGYWDAPLLLRLVDCLQITGFSSSEGLFQVQMSFRNESHLLVRQMERAFYLHLGDDARRPCTRALSLDSAGEVRETSLSLAPGERFEGILEFTTPKVVPPPFILRFCRRLRVDLTLAVRSSVANDSNAGF